MLLRAWNVHVVEGCRKYNNQSTQIFYHFLQMLIPIPNIDLIKLKVVLKTRSECRNSAYKYR